MGLFSLRLIKLTLSLVLIYAAPTVSFANALNESESERHAAILWEQAITAKGGREALNKVDSLAMSYQETVRNFLGIPVHRGPVERLYVFPDKSWEWDDGLPQPFRLSVRLLNIEQNLRCYLYAGAVAPNCGSALQGNSKPDEGITQVQYLYLMETRWVRPIPVGVTKTSIGFKKVDVLHTRFENKRIDYFLDRKTHLPVRVAVFYGSGDRATLTVDMSDYRSIGGLKMPAKQKRGEITFQINPAYDEDVLTTPPSLEKGPKAWERSR
jgi:hypothetical protein